MPHRYLFILLAALSMTGALSIDAYLPALPTIAQNFSSTLPAVQQTLTVYLCSFAFMTLFYGMLSDSFGRRPVILISLALYLGSTLGAALAPTLGWLYFFRLLQGFSAGAGGVVGRAIVADLLTGAEAQRSLAAISMVFGLAPALAPVLGGRLLAWFGWRSIFFAIAAFIFFLLIACICWLPESLAREKRHPFHFGIIVRHYLEVGGHARFNLRVVGAALMFIGILLYVTSAPAYVLNILHLGVKDFGWLFIAFIIGMMLGSSTAARVSRHLRPQTIIHLGYAITAVAAVGNLIYCGFLPPRVPWASLPFVVYGFGASLASPAMTVLMQEMFPHVRGMASSFQSFSFVVIFALLSGLVAPLLFDSAFKLASGAVLGLAASFLCWRLGMRGEPAHAALSPAEQLQAAEEAPPPPGN